MTSLPAVVTIPDLPTGTTLTGVELLEAVQTVAGVGRSIQIPISQIATTSLGGLPTGGTTGQFLLKSAATNFAATWSNLASAIIATSGITIVGSTTLTASLSTIAGLSVLGVAGTATAVPLPIMATASSQILQSNAGGTGLVFGALTTTLLPGPFQVSSFTANQVLIGNGTSPITESGVATTALPLVGNGTASAPGFAVLTVPGGGTGTTTLASNRVLVGAGTSTIASTNVATTGWPLVGNGTSAAPGFAVLGLVGGGTNGTTAISAQSGLGVRQNLTGLITFFVATTGSPVNNGLSSTTPFATLQNAFDAMPGLDTRTNAIQILVGDGTYTTGATLSNAPVGGGALLIVGNQATPANCVFNVVGSALTINAGPATVVSGFKFLSTNNGFEINGVGTFVTLSNYILGTCTAMQIQVSQARLFSNGAYTISGSAAGSLHLINGGSYVSDVATATMTGTPAWGSFFVGVSENSYAAFATVFSGAATGRRAFIHQGGIVETGDGSITPDTYFPGNAPSTMQGDGSYNDLFSLQQAAATATPGTPSAGVGTIYIESGTKALANVDDAGVVHLARVAATQAEMEGAIATAPVMTPFNAKWHPGVAKSLSYFVVSSGVLTNNFSFGMSSITRNSTGSFTLNFLTAFASSTAFVVIGFATNGVANNLLQESGTRTATTAVILNISRADGSLQDPPSANIAVYGDYP